MKNSKDGGFWINLESPDRRIMIFFFCCIAIIVTPIIVNSILSWKEDLFSSIILVLGGLIGSFSITGILSFVYYYKKAIISTRTILSWFTIFAFIFSAVANVVIYLLAQMKYFDSSTFFLFDLNTISIYSILWQFFALFLLALFVQIQVMFEAFGLIWMLAIVEKSTVPNTLADITKITSNTSNFIPKKDKLTSRRYSVLQWLFNMPDVLNTKLLTLKFDEQKKGFQWKALKTAVLWGSFLGFILTILIVNYLKSLAQISIENLLAISGLIIIMTPILVLSWFIFLRLDARIKGDVKDFKLYNGLKSRITSYTVTFGTFIILIRFALEKTDFQQLFWSFVSYYPIFLVSVTIFTFIYFNYFENDLAKNIANKYRKKE